MVECRGRLDTGGMGRPKERAVGADHGPAERRMSVNPVGEVEVEMMRYALGGRGLLGLRCGSLDLVRYI